MRICSSFFFNDTPPPEIYTLSLHDALPISLAHPSDGATICALQKLDFQPARRDWRGRCDKLLERRLYRRSRSARSRSEEHTSELQSLTNLVCRLLLEKKKQTKTYINFNCAS